MAELRTEKHKVELDDHRPIIEAAKELDVPFGCQNGMCGSCIVTVEEGQENLSDKNEKEEDMGLIDNERLACQCWIKTGTVKIKF